MPSIFGTLVWAIATKQKITYGSLPYRISQQSITHRTTGRPGLVLVFPLESPRIYSH